MKTILYHNGTFIEQNAPLLATDNRGFRYGDGVFDTMLALEGTPQFARAHFERLARHAAVMGIQAPVDFEQFTAAASEILQRNNTSRGDAVINTYITRGDSGRGLLPALNTAPHIIIRASALPPLTEPMHAIISTTTRRNEHSPLSRIKSMNYGDMVLARMEAQQNNAQEAILLNTAGHIACATIGNIFAVLADGTLATPPLSGGAMDGIIRARILKEYGAREMSITGQMLAHAKEIYITNSLRGAVALHSLDGKALPPPSILSTELQYEQL